MAETKRSFSRGLVRFEITDPETGEAFASFHLNPTDAGIAERAEEVADFFEKQAKDAPDITDAKGWAELDREVTDKICYLLGYDVRDELFHDVTATTVSTDGEIFAVMVFDMIAEALRPEMEKRAAHMQDKIDTYTAKYRDGV